jgi:hypothetical protein
MMLTARLLLCRFCRHKQCHRPPRYHFCALPLLLTLVLTLPRALTAQVLQPHEIIKFHLRDGYLIVVQTLVNGTGPFSFLLDTGSTRTVIDPELARQLKAPAIGDVSLTTVLHIRQDKLVQLEDVRLGKASVPGPTAIVDKLTRQKMLAPGIRGVLGEDFLSNFDLLIDYKGRSLHFGDAPPAGERCRFETIGQYHGSPTTKRLLIATEFMDVSAGKMQLQLDTGAKLPELFPSSNHSLSSQPWGGSMATSSGSNDSTLYSNLTIRIGTTLVRGVDVVQSRRAIVFDAVGLLPASIFQRIYISHSGGFIVLNPVESEP